MATANPLRYRGYYYDSETGMYYLQSRYYDPDLGRFISADDFDCLTTSNFFSANAYAYCWNSPIAFKDSEGNTPNLALAYTNIKAFLVDVNGKIAEKLEAKKQKFLEKLPERVENLKAKFDEAKEKAKYYLKNPDVFASKIASRIAGHEVTVRFPALELIRGMTKLIESVVDKSENSNISSSKHAAKKKDDKEKSDSRKSFESILQTIFQSLVAAIELDAIDRVLKEIGSSLEKISKHAFNAVTETLGIILTTCNTVIGHIKDGLLLDLLEPGSTEYMDKAGKFVQKEYGYADGEAIGKGYGKVISGLHYLISLANAGNGKFSKTEDIIAATISLTVGALTTILLPESAPIVLSIGIPMMSDLISEIFLLRKHGYVTQ